MGKIIRFLLLVVLILFAVIAVLGIIEPRALTVQRTVMINAPADMVFNQVSYFKNWEHWSPWYQAEPTMTISYIGNDGTPGSSFHWVSKKQGEGTMTDTAINNGAMDYTLNMLKPFKNSSSGTLKTESLPTGGTKVTWLCNTGFSYPWNAMLAFWDMDKMLGGDFEKGLQNLKNYTEKASAGITPAGINSFSIKDTVFAAHTYMGIRKQMAWAEMQKFFSDSYSAIGRAAGSVINGSPVGIFYTWDTTNQKTDIAAAFPVTDTSKPVNGGSCIYIPQSKAYMAVEKGGYSNAGKIHKALMDYVAAKGKRQKLVIEEYIVNPQQEKDSAKWVTNVYYLVD